LPFVTVAVIDAVPAATLVARQPAAVTATDATDVFDDEHVHVACAPSAPPETPTAKTADSPTVTDALDGVMLTVKGGGGGGGASVTVTSSPHAATPIASTPAKSMER
jgi:hypothetical protein